MDQDDLPVGRILSRREVLQLLSGAGEAGAGKPYNESANVRYRLRPWLGRFPKLRCS